MELDKIFGKQMKLLRIDKGYSQALLAEKTGLHLNSISFLERGINQPNLGTIFLIAKALEIKPEELVALVSKEYVEK